LNDSPGTRGLSNRLFQIKAEPLSSFHAGIELSGFNDSTKADVTWTPPGPGTFEISFNDFICRQTVNVRQRNSSIRIDKSCDYEGPVHIGDAVTYGYNITNTGELELTDVKVTDIQNWGPECLPMYAKGDDGDGVLDPGEMWRYECRYVVADPLDYPVLRIMSAESSFAKTKDLIRRLMDMKDRLEICFARQKNGVFSLALFSLIAGMPV
jgi:hypothetical protein